MSELRKRIGRIVRDRRQAMEMSQEKLAEAIDKTPGFIGQIERGESLPSIETLEELIHTLGLNAGQIFCAEYDPSDYEELFSMLGEMSPKKRVLLLELAKFLYKIDI